MMERSAGRDLEALLQIAESLEGDGDIEGALLVYNDILATAPHNPDALVGRGRTLHRAGRHEQAARFLRRATEADPDRVEAWRLLGDAALAAGDGEMALNAFTRLQKHGTEPATNYLNLARAAYFALDMERARDYIELSLAENPDSRTAKEWESSLKSIPDHAAFLVDVGRAHGRRGRFQEGLSLFLQALDERETAEGHLYAGQAMLALAKSGDAVPHLSRAREMGNDHRELLLDLAVALALAGETAEAINTYNEILDAEPDSARALLGKAQMLVEAEDYASAQPLVQRLSEVEPQNPATWFLQASIDTGGGATSDARLAIEKAIVQDPQSPVVWLAAARHLDRIGLVELARVCHLRAEYADTGKAPAGARKMKPELPPFKTETAELEGAPLVGNKMVEALRNRATVYANLGFVERALAYLSLILERFPEHETEELSRHRGSLQLRLGKPAEARKSFERALELNPESERARIAIQRLDNLAV